MNKLTVTTCLLLALESKYKKVVVGYPRTGQLNFDRIMHAPNHERT